MSNDIYLCRESAPSPAMEIYTILSLPADRPPSLQQLNALKKHISTNWEIIRTHQFGGFLTRHRRTILAYAKELASS